MLMKKEKVEINKIHQGDCLQLMREIQDKSIDMILCDLPYGTTACKWDVIIPLNKLWEQYKRIIKDKGAIILFGTEPFSSKLRISNLNMYKYDWVWDKKRGNGHLIAKKRPMQQTENISIFSYGTMTNGSNRNMLYFPQMEKREKPRKFIKMKNKHSEIFNKHNYREDYNRNDYTHRFPKNLISLSWSLRNGLHPTEKPVKLFEYLIKTYTKEGDLVLDNCIGSGTTAVACIKTKRNFIGIEKEEKYCEIANKRIKEAKEQTNLL